MYTKMFNLTSRKVLVPGGLFTLISLVRILKHEILLYAILFAVIYRFIAHLLGMVLQPADLIVPTLLFILLSLNTKYSILIRAAVFILVFAFLRKQFPKYY